MKSAKLNPWENKKNWRSREISENLSPAKMYPLQSFSGWSVFWSKFVPRALVRLKIESVPVANWRKNALIFTDGCGPKRHAKNIVKKTSHLLKFYPFFRVVAEQGQCLPVVQYILLKCLKFVPNLCSTLTTWIFVHLVHFYHRQTSIASTQ